MAHFMTQVITFFLNSPIFAPMFKQLAAFFLLIAFVCQTFSNGWVMVEYYANTAAFAKNCENKAKPAMHCNGKCQMMKKIKAAESKEQQMPERKMENKIELFSCSSSNYHFENIFSEITAQIVVIEKNHSLTDISLSLFRPPQQA
jgi:hypothetical protein